MIVPILSSTRLVGRDAELQLLHETRRALSSGRGAVVLIGGEAGMGKTRLLAEFKEALTGGRAPHYALGECLQDAPRPFGPFRTVLAKLAHVAPTSPDGSTALIRRALGILVPDAADSATTVTNPPAIEKAELFTGVLRFLESIAAKRAIVVALEDLHWADAASLELLVHVTARIAGSRLMIIATYRNDEVNAEHPLFNTLARLTRESLVRQAVLEPLPEHDVRALIHDALGDKYVLKPRQIRDVITQSEGNPFFTEEILKKTLEGRQESADAGLPISLRAMTHERLVVLNRDDRQVLDHAAVLGQEFDVGTLAAITRRERRDVLASLRRLRDLNLIVEETEPKLRFRFRHVLTRQAVYDELLSVDTKSLHAQIIAFLEAQPDADARIDELAYHAWKAALPEPMLRYSERAGDAALFVRAADQAAAYFERALVVADDDDARVRLLGKAGEAYVQLSDFGRATAACMNQHEMLLERGEFDAAAFALTRAAAEFANSGQIQKALALIDAFDIENGDRLSEAAADHLHSSLARMATAGDDFDRARTALAKVRDPKSLAAFTHQVYWLAKLFCAEHDVDALTWRSAAAALRLRNPETYPLMRSQLLHSIASTGIAFAENVEALRAVDEAIAIDREFGFVRALAYANSVKACVLAVMGKLVEGRACIVAALAEPDMFVIRLEVALGASTVAIALGDDELAQRCLDDDVYQRILDAGMPGASSLMTGMRAARLFALGETEQARRLLDDAIDGEQHQFAAVHFWPLAARYADDRRLARLQTLCAQRAANPDYRVMHACGALLDAAAAARSGDARAAELVEIAVARYRDLGWPLHEAQALELAGDTEPAVALYRACGSVADVRRLAVRTSATAPAVRTSGSPRLSPREREVAALVARGLTNRAIANKLSVGEKTVEKYVSAIYVKLSFSTRAQLAAYVARSEL